jgi:nitrite reductase (NADH) large subunit
MLGAVLIGDTREYDLLLQYLLNAIDLPASPETLILPLSGEKPSLDVSALPNAAIICSCHNVSKGEIINSIVQGACTTMQEVKTYTKASTGCGGCSVLLQSVATLEFKKRGIDAKKGIFESVV